MITKEYGVYKLVCDICYKEAELDSFEDCIEHMKKAGWTTEREDVIKRLLGGRFYL